MKDGGNFSNNGNAPIMDSLKTFLPLLPSACCVHQGVSCSSFSPVKLCNTMKSIKLDQRKLKITPAKK
ncbi:hypothetical protein COLO4_13284 [Corchorus olitorius]|uniref:Uncharacterized protein n=1 Tax=Corchorus olitorius TaxID=93759 RepID=A0A1R3JX68_9ROSI|nr:hypothetical protein COLO4_13284 [Corchorus olitorius]